MHGVLVGRPDLPSHCGAVWLQCCPAAAVSSFPAAAVAASILLPAPQFAMASGLGGSPVSPLAASSHTAPFTFIRRVGDRDVQHVLQWDGTWRRPNHNGVFGWTKCLRNCSGDAALPADGFRIHVCGHHPCTADYPASKYGRLPPPLAHGRVAKLLTEGDAWPECEPECELSAPLAAVPPPLPPPLPPPADSPDEAAPAVVGDAFGNGGDTAAVECETAAPSPGGLPASSHAAAVAADVDAPVIVAETIVASSLPAVTASQAGAMLARAEAAGQPRRLTGSLELVAFCCFRKRRLYVQLIEGWVDIMAAFAPSLVDASWHVEPFPVELFLCRWSHARKQWELAAWNDASHFMAGIHVPGVGAASVVGTSAVAEGLRRGFIVMETVCDGDCCLDALTIADGAQRTAENRLRLRLAIRDVLTVQARNPAWANVVEATQEVDVPGAALPDGAGQVRLAGSSQPMPRGRGAEASSSRGDGGLRSAASSSGGGSNRGLELPEIGSTAVLSQAAGTTGTPAGSAPVQGTPAAPVPATGAPPQPLADLIARDAPAAALAEAVRWATGLPNPTAEMVQRLCRILPDDHASALVNLHRQALQETAVAVAGSRRAVVSVRPRRKYKQSFLWQRLADARSFTEWAATRGIDHRRCKVGKELRDFVLAAAGGNLSKAQVKDSRRYMLRALKALREGGAAVAARRRGPGADIAAFSIKFRHRRRRLGHQGRPQKAGLVKELLFEWFCNIKRSVKGRLPAVVVMTKARLLMEEFVAEHLRRGRVAPAAVINSPWLTRWKRQYGVSLRQPNRKWKVSRSVLKDRLRIGWSNILRVRKLIALVHGYDPVVEDFDQSPFHMNESGPRGRGTLTLRGCPSVPLKECHAATRERYTANTMTTSSEARARQIPPLEILFKAEGGGSRMLPALQATIPPWAPWLAVAASPSGSYSEAEVLDYMERHLEPMHPGRDWRILLVDSYKAQLTDPVRHLAWHRGYVLVVHGGGATGVVQPNDTDLHGELKAQYCALEMAELLEQQRLKPRSMPHVRKSDALCWMATVWAQPELHLAAVAGYKKTGLTNALDGSEDNQICREAKEFWDELRMPAMRAELLRTVEVEFTEGRLAWNFADVSDMVVPFPRTGTPADNQPDDEGSEPPNEPDNASDDDDDGDDGGHGAGGGIGAGDSAVAEPADVAAASEAGLTARPAAPPSHTIAPCGAPALSHADADRAQVHQYNLSVLKAVAEQLHTAGQDRLLMAVEAAIHAEERRAHGRGQTDPAIAAALVHSRDANLSMVMDGRSLMEKLDEERKRNQVTLAELRKEQARIDDQRAALQRANSVVECFNTVKSFDAADFGQGHPRGGTRDHKRTRMQVLERLRSRSAPLPAELANDWEWFKVNWDDARLRRLHHTRRDAWGSIFRDIILELLDKTKKGEPNVLAKWMAKECREHLAMPVLRI